MNHDFELLPHTADIKIRVYGKTLDLFFRNALIAMFQSVKPIIPDCRIINERIVCETLPQHHEIRVSAPHIEMLLVDYLSEALYLSDVHNEAYLDATMVIATKTELKAIVRGIAIKGFELEIKAVTYHGLVVEHKNDHWQADIVFDI